MLLLTRCRCCWPVFFVIHQALLSQQCSVKECEANGKGRLDGERGGVATTFLIIWWKKEQLKRAHPLRRGRGGVSAYPNEWVKSCVCTPSYTIGSVNTHTHTPTRARAHTHISNTWLYERVGKIKVFKSLNSETMEKKSIIGFFLQISF